MKGMNPSSLEETKIDFVSHPVGGKNDRLIHTLERNHIACLMIECTSGN